MKLAYKLYLISKLITADAKFSGVIVTYPAKTMKHKKFNKAINKAISLKYLGDLNNTKGSHYTYKHIAWLGEQKTFGYAMSKHGTEVDASYIDQFVMLCAKVKTILDKAKEKNVTLPLKNQQNKNMNLDQYEKHFGITKDIAQQNVNVVVNQLFE